MRICIIANGYPSKREPQWGCFERDQALALLGQGHQVSILYIDKRFRAYWRKIGFTHFEANGISVYGIFLFPSRWFARLFGDRAKYWLSVHLFNMVFRKFIKNEGLPDVIYAHYMNNIYCASLFKKKYSIPLVGIEHWSELNQPKLTPIQMAYGRVAYENVDKLLSVSESLKNQIKYHFGKDADVVYDMLGQEFIGRRLNLPKDKQDYFSFVAVGSLLPIKNYDLLIKAFAASGLTNKGCVLTIVGNGPEHPKLQNLIEEHNILNSVVLPGRKTKNEIVEMLSASQVFVLSSKAETFGVSCIEALSQGLPAIATKCGGPEEFINENNGILVPTNDVDALSKAMIEMYNNFSKYDSAQIRKDCLDRFAPQVIAKQLSQIFEEVIK